MALLSVQAYGFATTFKLRELPPLFGGAEVRIDKDRLLATYAPGQYALAYDFGGLVFVGVDEAIRREVAAAVQQRNASEPPALTESFNIEVAPGPLEVRFDRVVVPELTLAVVHIVSLVVAQSVAMDYYAKDVEEIEAETDRIATQLRGTGRMRGRVEDLTRFIGLCIATRNDVISTLALFDKPDETWENEQLDRLWNGLHHMLEIDDRYRMLEAKLHLFQDNLVLMVDLAQQKRTLALEMAVVFLILLEMLLMVWQVMSAAGHH